MISGTRFRRDDVVVIGGLRARVIDTNRTAITAVTPPHAGGTFEVSVVHSDGGGDTMASAFTYINITAPAISIESPSATEPVLPMPGSSTGVITVVGNVVAEPGSYVSIHSSATRDGLTIPFPSVCGVIRAGRFYANDVGFAPREFITTLTAAVTNPDGSRTEQRIVLPPPSNNLPIELRLSETAGLAPHIVRLSYTSSIPQRQVTNVRVDIDSDATPDVGTLPPGTEASFSFANSGVYLLTVAFSDSQGAVYSMPYVIEVLDRATLDAQLKPIFRSMNNAIAAGNVELALAYISESSRDRWRDPLTRLQNTWATISASFSDPEGVEYGGSSVQYLTSRASNGVQRVSFLTFVKDSDCQWRIHAF